MEAGEGEKTLYSPFMVTLADRLVCGHVRDSLCEFPEIRKEWFWCLEWLELCGEKLKSSKQESVAFKACIIGKINI